MKIAVLSDIHGNSYALKQVLNRAADENVNELLILGDFVGYYYHPEKVLELLKPWKFSAVRGNHEDLLAGILDGSADRDIVRRKYGSGHNFAIEKLSVEQKNFLLTLPIQREVKVDGVSFLLLHGAPWDKDYYLYPDCEEQILKKCDVKGVDFVLAGHSHYAFSYRNEHSTFINAGSVGQSRNQSGLAQWTLINTKNKTFEMRSTHYDSAELLKEVEIADPENLYLKDVVMRNR